MWCGTKRLLLTVLRASLRFPPYCFRHLCTDARYFSHAHSFLSSSSRPLHLSLFCLSQPLINFSFPLFTLQPPVEALHSLHLIFLKPTLSVSFNFLQFDPLLVFFSLIHPSAPPPFFPHGIWTKCLMSCNK